MFLIVSSATAAAGIATAVALSAYLNGKYHIWKDLSYMYYQRRGARYQESLKKQNKINIWNSFAENAKTFADRDCIWYSDPSTTPPTVHSFTWTEAYQHACKYSEWFLSVGVRPGECVGFYLQNSPDFVLAWMRSLAIGCYPAMINYNLVGGALVHCTKIAECALLLADEDFQDRVLDNEELKAMGVRSQVVDREFRNRIASIEPRQPDSSYTKDANEKTRLAIRYTRYCLKWCTVFL